MLPKVIRAAKFPTGSNKGKLGWLLTQSSPLNVINCPLILLPMVKYILLVFGRNHNVVKYNRG